MSQQAKIKRSRTNLWQFSIIQLLAAIYLVAVTCGAFRFNMVAGVWATHFSIAIALAFARSKTAIRHHEELWDVLEVPDWARSNEIVWLAITSFGVALIALFLFHVGFWSAAILVVIPVSFFPGLLFPFFVWILAAIILGSALLLPAWWLSATWPRP